LFRQRQLYALTALASLVMAPAFKITRHIELLTALVAAELANPLLADAKLAARIVSIVLFSLVCVAVFRALFHTKRRRWIGSILVGATIALSLARLFVPTELRLQTGILLNVSAATFYVFVFSVIVSHVFSTRQLRTDDVVGAFSGYMLIALVWGRLYALAWMLEPSYFSISPNIGWQLHNWNTLLALFDFYSFTTISTIGYAAITTVGPSGNTLVWLEVMCGQFYMAVVVATIVGMKLAEALSSPRDGN
jgi:voltage-gated potassium channel